MTKTQLMTFPWKHLLRALPLWLWNLFAQIPLILVGLVLVAIGVYFRLYVYRGTQLAWSTRLLWLWGNDENGIDGAYGSLPQGWPKTVWPKWRQVFVWSALRNSVGNARWTRAFGMTVDPYRRQFLWPLIKPGVVVRVIEPEYQKTGMYFVRQGWRYELKLCWNIRQPDVYKRRYFWIGWRIAQQVVRMPGVGFAFQPWAKL